MEQRVGPEDAGHVRFDGHPTVQKQGESAAHYCDHDRLIGVRSAECESRAYLVLIVTRQFTRALS